MKYYDSSGKQLKRGGWYYKGGELLPIPTMFDDKETILRFVETCVKENNPSVTMEDLELIWDEYMSHMKTIIDSLKIIRDQEREKGSFYRVRAYNNAISVLSRLDFPIVSGKQARKLRGIGESIGNKIDEIIKTGKLKKIEQIKREGDKQEVLKLFESLQGIGSVKAREWYSKGYRKLEDIEKHEWDSLPEATKITLRYHDFLSKPIPRESIEYQKEFLEAPLYYIDPKAKFKLVGSYRRGLPFSNDVDVLISSKYGRKLLDQYVDFLVDGGDILHILQRKKEKITTVSQILKSPKIVKMDFFYSPWESWGVGLLAWTGPKNFSTFLRQKAKQKGMKLSHVALQDRKTGKVIPTPSERSVFKALGMDYIPPEQRY